MSVNLMSAIFETEFFDLTDQNGNVTKASTAKLVLLAMADHANDEGEGSYPSIERLCRKTALSAQTIRNTFDALRHNGIIELQGLSKHGTNNHTINTKSFPKAIGKEVTVLTLYPLDPSNESLSTPLTSNVTPLPVIADPSLTIIETPSRAKAQKFENLSIENQIAAGVERVVLPDETKARRVDFSNLVALGTTNPPEAYAIAMAFQEEQNMTLPTDEKKVKGQRLAIKEMLDMNVTAEHVRKALRKLQADHMTISSLFSVRETAIAMAHAVEETFSRGRIHAL